MAFDLSNKAGDSIKVSGGHWAVFLTLAETFGWISAKTRRPLHILPSEDWNGRYDSNDGQVVEDADAKSLAKHIHGAAVSDKVKIALSDVIAHVERQVQQQGTIIPDSGKMKPEDFYDEFSPLLLFLYQGEFIIE